MIVNRIWQQHFGVGFVSTPDDLGNQSAPPTYPELLDYLATRLVEQGWSIKKLQRLIVLSSVYQESSAGNPRYAETDPDNKLLWRYNLHRLDFEEIHDELLADAGTLDLDAIGGPSIPIGSADFVTRRALYTYVDRRNPPELLDPVRFSQSERHRGPPLHHDGAAAVALPDEQPPRGRDRAPPRAPAGVPSATSDDERVRSLFLAVFQRPPTAQENPPMPALRGRQSGRNLAAGPAPGAASAAADRAAQAQANLALRVAQNGALRRNAPQVEAGAAAFRSRAPLDAWTKLGPFALSDERGDLRQLALAPGRTRAADYLLSSFSGLRNSLWSSCSSAASFFRSVAAVALSPPLTSAMTASTAVRKSLSFDW